MNKKIIRSLLLCLILLSIVCVPAKSVTAEGATITMAGSKEASTDEDYELKLSIDSPADIAHLSVVIKYNNELLDFKSIDSSFFTLDENSSEGMLRIRAVQVNITKGETDLGSVIFCPKKNGVSTFHISTASAFTVEDFIIGVNAGQSFLLTLIDGDDFIPLPTIAPTTSMSTETTTSNIATSDVSTTALTTSSEYQNETSFTEETSIMEESTTVDISETIDASITENELSTTTEETSTISTESSNPSTTSESAVGSNNDDRDNDDRDNSSRIRIIVVVVLILLLATGITVAINRKK